DIFISLAGSGQITFRGISLTIWQFKEIFDRTIRAKRRLNLIYERNVVAQTDPCPKSALGYPKSNILISDIPNRNFYLCPKSNLGYPNQIWDIFKFQTNNVPN